MPGSCKTPVSDRLRNRGFCFLGSRFEREGCFPTRSGQVSFQPTRSNRASVHGAGLSESAGRDLHLTGRICFNPKILMDVPPLYIDAFYEPQEPGDLVRSSPQGDHLDLLMSFRLIPMARLHCLQSFIRVPVRPYPPHRADRVPDLLVTGPVSYQCLQIMAGGRRTDTSRVFRRLSIAHGYSSSKRVR